MDEPFEIAEEGTRRRGGVVAVVAAAVLALAPAPPAKAGCGLTYCPDPIGLARSGAPLRLDLGLRAARFHLPYATGEFKELMFRGEFRPGGWALGAAVPLVFVNADRGKPQGIGNSSLFAERRLVSWLPLSLGLQVELPGAKSLEGLSSDHTELLPYGAVGISLGPVFATGRAGYRQALKNAHAHASGVPLLVDPHADKELLYHGSLGVDLPIINWRPETYFSGQQALQGPGAGQAFLNGGFSMELSATPILVLRPFVELPLTLPQRAKWRAGVTTSLRLPLALP